MRPGVGGEGSRIKKNYPTKISSRGKVCMTIQIRSTAQNLNFTNSPLLSLSYFFMRRVISS